MIEEFQEEQRRKMSRVRATLDYTMGILLIIAGLYFLLYEKLGFNLFQRQPSSLDYLIGGLFILYGGWRVYRGYKKDYFR